jgi:hypothetical protein
MNSQRNLSAFCVVFGVVFSLAYLLAVWKNYALFTYHPAIGAFAWGAEKAREGGPAMYWYGWIATAGIAGAGAGLIAAILPARYTLRLWSGLAWLAPLCAMVVFGYILRNYFLH